MNGKQKFHSPDGPAFNAGEVWVSCDGQHKVTIHRTVRYGVDKWDVDVFYWVGFRHDPRRFIECSKDAWNFQVRYQHQADKEI